MKFSLLTGLFMIISTVCKSQKTEIELKDLIVPSSPAFSLLDFNPKIIERPGTIKALALNIVNETGEAAGIPKNFALEFAPYWFFKHPNMDLYKYHGIILKEDDDSNSPVERQNIFAGLRSASISFGSVFKDSSKSLPVDVNYIAFGVRANVVSIKKKRLLDSLVNKALAINERLSTIITEFNGCSKFEDGTPEYLKCFGEGMVKVLKNDSIMKELREDYTALTKIRPLFAADLALASSLAFGDNSFSNSRSYRTGAWLTLAFSQPLVKFSSMDKLLKNKNYLNAYCLVRFLSQNSTKDFVTFTNQKFFDVGGRIEAEFDKFALSVESIHRSNKKDKTLKTSRTVGIIQYKLTESFYFVGTFGKNFDKVKNLIALFGINWGFGGSSLFQKL